MKCLLYAQLPKSKQITDIDPDYFTRMQHYARMKDWDVVGFVSDENVNTDCAEKADLKNLRKILKSRKDLDAAIAAVSPTITKAEFAALKMIEKNGVHLIIWSNCNRPNDENCTPQ